MYRGYTRREKWCVVGGGILLAAGWLALTWAAGILAFLVGH